jgi:hypothetical protein
MDDVSNPSRPETGRGETRRELLLRRLAQCLAEMQLTGVTGPVALEDLIARNPPRR